MLDNIKNDFINKILRKVYAFIHQDHILARIFCNYPGTPTKVGPDGQKWAAEKLAEIRAGGYPH